MTIIELPGVLAPYAADVASLIESLPPTVSCVATGSLMEGFGNEQSDVDLYMINEDRMPSQSSSFGLRESGYVDCEYMKLSAVQQLWDRVNGCTWSNVDSLGLKDIDRYYRMAISHRIVVTPATADVLSRFTRESAGSALYKLAILRCFEQAARAAYLNAAGQCNEAELLVREGNIWWGTACLAREGEAYPSLKWLGEKAARRYGRGSPEFDELVNPTLRPRGSLSDRISALCSMPAVVREIEHIVASRSCDLAGGVQVLTVDEDSYLVKPGQSIVRVDTATAAVCRELAAGATWHDAVRSVAQPLRLSAMDLATALWCELAHLRAQNLLV